MVKLDSNLINTKEVLEWKGIHLFHFWFSACSQKVRLFLRLKEIAWESHVIDLRKQENHTDWYLGINPYGLVPCLVHNGDVHTESNDIMQYLESLYPNPPLLPVDQDQKDLMIQQLESENNLHLELRILTFAFLSPKKVGSLLKFANYKRKISPEPLSGKKEHEISFYENYLKNGITNEQIISAFNAWRLKFSELNGLLLAQENGKYFSGDDQISLLDIAWFINCDRLKKCGYPLDHHPRLWKWYNDVIKIEGFKPETKMPSKMKRKVAFLHFKQFLQHKRLSDVVKLKQERKGNLLKGLRLPVKTKALVTNN